jgi:hypothetical protein
MPENVEMIEKKLGKYLKESGSIDDTIRKEVKYIDEVKCCGTCRYGGNMAEVLTRCTELGNVKIARKYGRVYFEVSSDGLCPKYRL